MNYESDLPRHERELLQSILLRGEELRWTGRPIPFYLQKGVGVILIFGSIWLLMSIFMTIIFTLAEDVQLGTLLFMLPFHLIGLGFVSTPFFTHRRSKNTFYALTNKRVIIVLPGIFSGHKIKHFELAQDVIKEQLVHPNGRGDLVFGYEEAYRQNEQPVMRPVGFINLPDMRAVEDRIYKVLEEISQPADA